MKIDKAAGRFFWIGCATVPKFRSLTPNRTKIQLGTFAVESDPGSIACLCPTRMYYDWLNILRHQQLKATAPNELSGPETAQAAAAQRSATIRVRVQGDETSI